MSDQYDPWSEWLRANLKDEYRVFVGPCEHGRDPYDRCDICVKLTPEEAKARAELAAAKAKP